MKELHNILKGNRLAVAALALLCLWSCDKTPMPDTYKDTIYSDRKVMIVYYAGHNNSLSSYIQSNIKALLTTDFHTNDENADAVLFFTHTDAGNAIPYLIYPHKDIYGDLVLDTLVTYSANTISASYRTLGTVLTYVKEHFPADEYGLIFSSHGTGYLPAGYYDHESDYESDYTGTTGVNKTQREPGAFGEPAPVPDRIFPDGPITRSIGNDKQSDGVTYEINLEDFADVIPMKMKYIVFDACLLGGIEVAYQLRDVTDYLVASCAEIMGAGMDYSIMADCLMARPAINFEEICDTYYNMYNNSLEGGTISATDCTRLEPLAELCRELFSKYREALDNIDYSEIQRYYRMSYHWFFDLGDIIEHLGCTDEELAQFNELMDEAVIYKRATDRYLPLSGGFDITHFSGLSMMLPNYAGDYLKDYYKTNLDWNFATSLVE